MVSFTRRTLLSGASGAPPIMLRRYGPVGALVGIVLVALNLRGPIVAPSTVIDALSSSLGMDAAELALLTTIPVLCFALAVPVGALVIHLVGPERALAVSMGGVLIGSLVRVGGTEAFALVGTVLLGVAMTIGNISVPVLIKKRFDTRIGAVTGAYTAALNIGSVITALGTAPLAAAFGWRIALGFWAVLALAALVPWAVQRQAARWGSGSGMSTASGSTITPAGPAPLTSVLRRSSVWLLALAFGGQGFSYYALSAWLPEVLGDVLSLGTSASGAASALFQVSAIAGALTTPLVGRVLRPRAHFVVIAVAWAALPLAMLVAPPLWWFGSVLGGAAQGAAVTLVFIVVAGGTRTAGETARASGIVQFVGYGFGAAGPVLLGSLHDATGSWAMPLVLLVVASGVLGAAGWLAVWRHPVG